MQYNNRLRSIGILILLTALLPSVSFAQQVVVMPHHGSDTLTINRQNCYTILDPGGFSNYSNNEDSWLFIVSTSGPFRLKVNYQTGVNADCNDFVRIYYGSDTNNYNRQYCGSGSATWQSHDYWWRHPDTCALIHFHSNNYASFRGYEIEVEYPNSISDWDAQSYADSSMTITWQDNASEATEWTITYFCDEDSLMTATSNTKSVTLTGLRNDTYYGYYIKNNAVPCMDISRQYFIVPNSQHNLYNTPGGTHFNLTSDTCYTINGVSGPGNNRLSSGWVGMSLSSTDSTGFYADGWYKMGGGDYYSYSWSADDVIGSGRSSWGDNGNRKPHRIYFPFGNAGFTFAYNYKFHYRIVWENNRIITPTVTGLTATTATLQWSDTSQSTQWTVRYTDNESDWTSRTVTTPSLTLTGLNPGTQYIYTIEGNITSPCVTPFRHAFITTGSADTLIMPYRNNDTTTLQPGSCYTVVDAGGGSHNYFQADYSTYTFHTANGRGFWLKGWYNVPGPDRLFVYYEGGWHSYDGNNSQYEIYCADGSCTIGFTSDCDDNGIGFEFSIIQMDTAISQLHASSITTTGATLSWTDPDPSVTGWRLYYGNDEDNFASITTTTPTATLTGLTPGTQYVYYVTRQGAESQCSYSDRRAFITQGVPENTAIMPYRGIDTLVVTPGTCYTIYDAGGKDHNYFNNDTSQLIIVTADHSNFFVTGEFDYEDMRDLQYNGYDGEDHLGMGTDPYNSESLNVEVDGYYTWYNNAQVRAQSSNGFLRIRWRSNQKNVRRGFFIHIDQDTVPIEDVRFTHVKQHSAEIQWTDNSGYTGPWYVGYSSGTSWTTFSSNTNQTTLNNLLPGTKYQLRISRTPFTEGCNLQTHHFTTLGANDIVMNSHSRDTVWVTPGECYTVYDPGGIGDYYSSDSSTVVIRSTTGLGFRLQGSTDVSDRLSFNSDGTGGNYHYWGLDNWYSDGIAYLTLKSNEAINSSGFVLHITFYPTLNALDTLWMTDTSMAITWQDTSVANQWTITYGTHIDSLRTITTTTNQATLTGLKRNTQCYLQIESNFSSNDCVIPSIYGIRMHHDPDIWLAQYQNYYLNRCGRHSRVENTTDYLPVSECIHLYDNGGLNPPFPDHEGTHYFYSADGRNLSLQGQFNLGASRLNINASPTYTSYGGIGNLFVSSDNGHVEIYTRTDGQPHNNGEGFDFNVLMNYAIYQITVSNVTCSTAHLTWIDTSGASQWWIAYGEAETSLDTVTTTTRSYDFTNLVADRQYVCYLWSNEELDDCKAPVKKYFITACDTTIIIVPCNQDSSRILNINECYIIQDPGAVNNYHFNNNESLHLHTNTGDPITLRGSAHIRGGDYLSILDEGSWNWLCYNWSGDDDHFEVHSNTGHIRIEYHCNGDTLSSSGFQFDVSFNTIGNIRADLMTDSTCRIRWDDHSTATQWTFWYGSDREHMDSIAVNSKTVHLENLVDGTYYYVYITNNAVECIDTTWFEFCAGGDNCIDFANLYSCHTICRTGDFGNPDSYQGVVDYGPENMYSRHTVMLDTTYRDPRTGGLLRSIPEGHDHSVRLGNWNYGGEAESISYEYIVDTASADIMLLRYAAVLENPGHDPQSQPRFQFTITDEYNNPLDTRCYAADFVSSDQLDWNVYHYDTNTVLWKDWTAVGVDLEPLQGRRIYIKLTTYDCAETGHFGYAYFTLECDQKYIRSGACGIVDSNNFTAPEGFRYRWYNIDSANVTLDTTREFFSNQTGVYRCRASFIGDSSASCYFEKTAIVGNIFPFAEFDYQAIDTIGCRVKLRFQNLSRVATDPSYTILSNMECDSYTWDFGDGTTSYSRHPAHIFNPGYFNVRLTASLAGGTCTKDTVMRIAIPSPCIQYDTLYPVICNGDTFQLGDSALTLPGEYIVRQVFRSDSIRESLVYLTVNPVHDFYITDTLCTNQEYNRYGIHIPSGSDPYTTQHLVSAYQNIYSCDSVYHLTLLTRPAFEVQDTAIACDDLGYTLYNRTVYESGNYIDSLHSTAGCDSVVHLALTVFHAYHSYTTDTVCDGIVYPFIDTLITSAGDYTRSFPTIHGCDSAFHLALTMYPRYDFYDTVYLCPRQPYYHNNRTYFAPDIIIDSFITVNGCDSIYTTTLLRNDDLFKPLWEVSDDTLHWVTLADTLWEGCSPYTLYFRNRSTHTASSIWHFSDTTIHSQGPSPYDSLAFFTHTFETGRYTFYLSIADSTGCTDTLFNPTGVHVIQSPTADFYWDSTLVSELHPWTAFHNTSIPLDSTCSSLWLFEKQPDNPDDLDTAYVTNPAYRWDTVDMQLPASYLVWLILTQQNIGLTGDTLFCSDTVSDTVKIVPSTLQFPNIVTPNNDNYNDRFTIGNLLEYNRYPYNKLTIYDRWGHTVYEVNNISQEEHFWDPNSTNAPDGTYYYRFVGQGSDGSVQHNGVIEVLRTP